MATDSDIEHLFKAHYAQMRRLALTLLHDDGLARDVVHDVFVSILENPPAVQAGGSYLMRAVRNRSLNHIRDCGIHQRIASLYLLENEEYDDEDWPDEETLAQIDTLISSEISPQARRVIELRFSCGLPFARIAETMGISQTAVYRHLSHALKLIRQKLKRNG